MGNASVARCQGVARLFREICGVGLAVLIHLVASRVLPGVEGGNGIAACIQIHDAVHLPRDANRGDLGVMGKKLLNRTERRFFDHGDVLALFKDGSVRKEVAVFARQAFKTRAVLKNNGADGGGTDIKSKCFHTTPQILVDAGSRRRMMSSWIAGERSRKLTKVPWIRMMYTPLGAYFLGFAKTARRVSAVVTLT